MANISKGHAFSDGEQVTAVKLNSLVDDATIAGITSAAFSSGSHIITSSATTPTGVAAGSAWWDTTATEAEGNGILKIYDGTTWQSVAKNVENLLTNAAAVEAGDLVVFKNSADSSIETTTTEGITSIAGVVATATASSGLARVVRCGVVRVKTDGVVARGDYLGTSTVAGSAKSLGSTQVAGAFGIAIEGPVTTDVWLVALSGHTVDYVQKTATDVLLQQNSTDGTCDNNSGPSGGTIPGTQWNGSYVAADNSTGSETSASAGMQPLTWYDDSIAIAGERDVTVEGTVTVVANQMIHVELKDFVLAMMDSGSTRTRCSGAGLAVRIINNATGLTESIKHWPGWQTHTQGFVDQGTDDLTTAQVLPGMSTFLLENQTIGGHTLQDLIWWKALEHSFTADADGTYKVKVYWFVSRSGHNWNILNPNTTMSSTNMGNLGMGKPTLKVVTR